MNLSAGIRSKKGVSFSERLAIAREVRRTQGIDIVHLITSSYEELHGDRLYGDDRAVSCGIGILDGRRCIFIVQQKGSTTKERITHNFGMMNPEGYRKALRISQLAERFSLPIISIIDTPGAYPGLEAEKRGQGRAIADNLFEMSTLKVPIISLIVGEGCSGGALGIGICDRMIMLEHAYFSVISPEGCASILWKDARKKNIAGIQLKMQAENLLEFKMIDKIIDEGEGGFHMNKNKVLACIKKSFIEYIDELMRISSSKLIAARYKKYKSF